MIHRRRGVGAAIATSLVVGALAAVAGPASARGPVAAVVPTCTPAAPTAVGSAKDALTVAYAPCAGGPAPTGYRLFAFAGSASSASAQVDVAKGVTEAVFGSLTAGTTYRFKVAALDADGAGPSSAASAPATPPFTTVGAFTARQYQDFAGRAPTSAESSDWSSRIGAGTLTPTAAIDAVQGATYWQVQSPVIRLFQAYFLRLPDLGGLDYWAGRLRGGANLNTVSQSFASSAEFKSRYGSLSNQAFVNLVYQNVLGRPGEASGVTFWTGQLNAKKKNRGQVMVGFSESAEYKNKTTGTVDLVNLFTGMLRRVPTAGENTTWSPQSESAVIAFLLASSGYEARTKVVAPPAITTTALPAATVGTAYSAPLSLVGGHSTLEWFVSDGSLPDGLDIDSTTGTISGTPTTKGTSDFTVEVDDGTHSATMALEIVVQGFGITTTSPLPGATLSTPYSTTFTSAHGTAPVTWSTTDTLPAGLTLATGGLLSGTPTAAGTTTFSVTATDANSQQDTQTFALTVTVPAAPTVTNPALADADQNVAYDASLSVVGGSGPYTWSIPTGTLPAGLTLSPGTGLISGTPTTLGTSSFTVKVTGAGGANGTKALSITVVAATEWAQTYEDEGKRSWSPNESILTPANAGQVGEEWTADVGAGPVAISGGVVYTTGHLPGSPADTALLAYDLGSSALLWDVPTDCSGSGPAVTSTAVLVVCDASLRAYDRGGSHALLWDTAVTDPGITVSSFVVSGTTAVAWDGSSVTAYKLADGTRLWQQLPGSGQSVADVSVGAGKVVTSMSDRIKAYALSNGALSWQKAGVAGGRSVAAGTSVYVMADGLLTQYALADGTQGWQDPDTAVQAPFAVDDATVYAYWATFDFGDDTSELLALNAADGTQRWEATLPSRLEGVAVAGNLAWAMTSEAGSFEGNSSALVAYQRADGTVDREVDFDTRAFAPAAVAEGKVVAAPGSVLHVFGLAPPIPVVTTSVLSSGHVGVAYSDTLAASGGAAPLTWSIAGGSLPANLDLGPSGAITGTPTTAATSRVTFKVTDARGRTATRDLTVQISATGTGSWNTAGGSGSRNGLAATETQIDVDSAAGLALRWKTAAEAASGQGEQDPADEPVVVGSRIYDVSAGGTLYAWDDTGTTANRAPLWHADADSGATFLSGVTESGGTLYVYANDSAVYAFRASDGVKLWRTPTSGDTGFSGVVGAPVVVGSNVLVLDQDNKVWSMATGNGALAWGGNATQLAGGTGFASATPLATDGTRAFALVQCEVFAVNAATGAVSWSGEADAAGTQDCNPYSTTTGTPVVADGAVFIGSFGATAAFDAATGALRWRTSTGSGYGVVVTNGIAVVPRVTDVTADGWSYAFSGLDVKTGAVVWQNDDVPATSAPSVAGDLVVAHSNDHVVGLDVRTGDEVWDGGLADPDAPYRQGRPSIANGFLYLASQDDTIRAYGLP